MREAVLPGQVEAGPSRHEVARQRVAEAAVQPQHEEARQRVAAARRPLGEPPSAEAV